MTARHQALRLLLFGFALAGCLRFTTRPSSPLAWSEVREACREGEQAACFWLAVRLQEAGKHDEAQPRYERACAAGVELACDQLVVNLFYGNGVKKNEGLAVQRATAFCEAGMDSVCHLVGIGLFRGRGAARDLARSTALYERACEAGKLDACRDLGNALAEGRGVPVDLPRARSLWRKACPSVNAACDVLAESLAKKDPKAALAIAKEGCRHGWWRSCLKAGELVEDSELKPRYHREACALQPASPDAQACYFLGYALRAYKPPLVDEALDVWKDSCRAGSRDSCVALMFVEYPKTKQVDLPKVQLWCDEGRASACIFLCRQLGLIPACAKACAMGEKLQCEFAASLPDAGVAPNDAGILLDGG